MLAPFVGGCENRCRGPACEGAWPAGRLAVHRGAVWERELNAWAEATAVLDGTEAQGAEWSVAVAQERLVVGMPEADEVVIAAIPGDGEQDLSPTATWEGPTSEFGAQVAVGAGFDLWVGAPGASLDRGAVYRFSGAQAGGGASEADLVVSGLSPGDRLGARVSLCGDLTGDGLPDVAIGAPHLSAPPSGPLSGEEIPELAGAVFVLASEDMLSGEVAASASAAVLWGEQVGDAAGSAIVCDRDHDGDGRVDLLVGAPFGGEADSGRVFVITELQAGWMPLSAAAFRTVTGPEAGAWAGWSLASADLTQDGEADLVVGAPGAGSGDGAVYVYDGAVLTSGLAQITARFSPPDDRDGDHVGKTVAIGDLDADGLPDLLIGAPDWREGDAYDVGLVSVWRGSRGLPSGLAVISDDEATRIVGSQPFQRIGSALSLGALDDDGLGDDLFLPTRYGGP